MRLAWLVLAVSTPALAAPSAGKLVTIDADIDGVAGDEKITLDKDGTLTAGPGEISVTYDETDGPTHTKVEVISLGGKRRGVYLVTEHSAGEDPPNRHQVFFYDKGSLKLVFNQLVTEPRIVFSKGVGRYPESGWDACNRVAKKTKGLAKRATKQIIALRLDAKGTKLVESRTRGTEVQECDELSACPFVYEIVDGQPVFMGEILRNIRYTSALQGLAIGKGTGARIRLTEEKPEITFVDELYLEVDGVRVAPKACGTDPTLAYCSADGRYHVMTRGDVLMLDFDAKPGMRQLFARGYYTPVDVADRNAATSR
jgi:hypothetical protein